MTRELENFVHMVQEDKKRAKALFFSESFKENYLSKSPEYQEIYHLLLLGRNREQMLEEFLITIGAKDPVSLECKKESLSFKEKHFDEPMIVTFTKKNWGYAKGKISVKGQLASYVRIDPEIFDERALEEGELKVHLYLKEVPEEDMHGMLHVDTLGEALDLPLIYRELMDEEAVSAKEKEKALLRTYMDFCIGKSSKDEFLASGNEVLRMPPAIGIHREFYGLISVHLGILGGSITKIDTRQESDFSSKELYCYHLYLKSLASKKEVDISTALHTIEDVISDSKYKGLIFWLKMYLDVTLAFDGNMQIQKIEELYKEGVREELLWFEVCLRWNENPELLEQLDSFTLQVLQFGAKEALLKETLIDRVHFLISRKRSFSKDYLSILCDIYTYNNNKYVLQGICSLLIQGNQMNSKYHTYYEKAVKEQISLGGLQEAFFRTIPKKEYPILPSETLSYFIYSNSLSRVEQSHLYANVIKNQKRYQEQFANYKDLMISFTKEELKKGSMNESLVILYQFFFGQLIKEETVRQDIGNIIFQMELEYHQPLMKKISVNNPAKEETQGIYLNEDTTYVEVFGTKPIWVFFDQREDRYIGSVKCQWKRVWKEEQVAEYCKIADGSNDSYLLYLSSEYVTKTSLEEEDFPMVLKILECPSLSQSYYQIIYEKVLKYYMEQGKEEELKESLEVIDWKDLEEDRRRPMLEYFIAGGMYDQALHGVSQYGYQFIRPNLLKRLCVYALSMVKKQRSEMLTGMCYRAFELGEYNNDIIHYLEQNFVGTKNQMLKIWNAGSEENILEDAFVENLLDIALQEGLDGREFSAYEVYLGQKEIDKEFVDQILDAYVHLAWEKKVSLPEKFYELVGRRIDIGKKDTIYQGIYLDFCKNRPLKDIQAKRIQEIWDIQIQTGYYFPKIFEFKDYLKIPKYLCGKTFVEYNTEAGQALVFHYALARGQEWREVPMVELMPGYYVASEVVFTDEVTDYFITVPGEEYRRRKDIHFIDYIEMSKGSRFYELNEMLNEKNRDGVQSLMDEYARKMELIDLIQPMIEE